MAKEVIDTLRGLSVFIWPLLILSVALWLSVKVEGANIYLCMAIVVTCGAFIRHRVRRKQDEERKVIKRRLHEISAH